MAVKNFLITGITDLLVLSILKEMGDSYVYEICKFITNESDELLSISPNTIYTVMYKLEEEKKISEYSKLVGKKRTRVYYHIEQPGVEYLEELKTTYSNMTKGVESIFDSINKSGGSTNE
ncbi:MAG: PadR family transcriptional regulator [Lachnospiraceae bacterium]|nr:PadR family transcriptional regulator [Lachnospiraceae bacterium]